VQEETSSGFGALFFKLIFAAFAGLLAFVGLTSA